MSGGVNMHQSPTSARTWHGSWGEGKPVRAQKARALDEAETEP